MFYPAASGSSPAGGRWLPRPSPAHRYFQPCGCSRVCLFHWHRRPGSHVPYESQVELRAAYMPDVARAVSGIPQADPGGRVTPGSDIASSAFDTSATVRLRSLLSTVPAGILSQHFPQRSPPSLLATAACGGLRSTPDCRTQRVLLHLSYSCASPRGLAMLVTQEPMQTWLIAGLRPGAWRGLRVSQTSLSARWLMHCSSGGDHACIHLHCSAARNIRRVTPHRLSVPSAKTSASTSRLRASHCQRLSG
jgi:hypothetical protein